MLPDSDNRIAAKLLLSSTSSIANNIGFNTAKSSSLDTLNILLTKFLENLSQDAKNQAEHVRGPGADPSFEDMLSVLAQLGINWESISDYLHSVAPFPSPSAIPLFPIQKCNFDPKPTQIGELTMDITLLKSPRERLSDTRQSFPNYANRNAKELQMSHLVDENRYATSSSTNANETLDSLASPILVFRRPVLRKRPYDRRIPPEKGNIKRERREEEKEEEKFKSVLSRQGLKLRLLNNNADTPPGYFSSRSKIKKK